MSRKTNLSSIPQQIMSGPPPSGIWRELEFNTLTLKKAHCVTLQK